MPSWLLLPNWQGLMHVCFLFGSRVHDELRGGDIDLLVECPHSVERPVRLAMQLTARIQRALSDQRIDVLVLDPSSPLEGVYAEAQREGVLLCAAGHRPTLASASCLKP